MRQGHVIHDAIEVEDCGDDGMRVSFRGQHVVELVAGYLHPADWDGLSDALADNAGNLTVWTVWARTSDEGGALARAIRWGGFGVSASSAVGALERGPSSEKDCPECNGCGRTREAGWSS